MKSAAGSRAFLRKCGLLALSVATMEDEEAGSKGAPKRKAAPKQRAAPKPKANPLALGGWADVVVAEPAAEEISTEEDW